MQTFDPTKSFGKICGQPAGFPTARYSQGGAFFDTQHRCVKDSAGNALTPGSDTPNVPAIPTAADKEDAPDSPAAVKLKKQLHKAEQTALAVPSTVNRDKVAKLEAELAAIVQD